MNKDLIRKRFNKNLETYNKNAFVQKKMAKNILDMTDKKEYGNILEIGCGTGLLTEMVFNNICFENYTAIDIVKNCENYINTISKDICFIEADMENFIENNINKYDLILSNASFQWIDDIQDFIQKLMSRLNSDGTLIFSMFGAENFKEINFALNNTPKYYSINQLEKIFSKYNTVIKEEKQVLEFKTPKEVLKHISLTGVNAIEETFWTKSDLKRFETIYNEICSNSPTLTYNPIYIKITSKNRKIG